MTIQSKTFQYDAEKKIFEKWRSGIRKCSDELKVATTLFGSELPFLLFFSFYLLFVVDFFFIKGLTPHLLYLEISSIFTAFTVILLFIGTICVLSLRKYT